MGEPTCETYVKILLASRSTAFLTTTTRKNTQITRYEGKEINFPKVFPIFFFFFFLLNRGIHSHENGFIKPKKLPTKGVPRHVSRPRSAGSIFVLLDFDPGKLYAIPKCFRDTDTTAKSVSSNSSSKNSNTAIYVNSGKLKILKISNLNSGAS